MNTALTLAALSLPNLISRMPGGIAQGIIWGIMALGVYITFRLLDIADLSVDGSFATGGAVTVMLILAGYPAYVFCTRSSAYPRSWQVYSRSSRCIP